jgi:hypothetical protein
MKKGQQNNFGIELLIEKYRTAFRIPENFNHYSEEDYKVAERRFLKYAMEHRIIEIDKEFSKA